MTETPDLPVEQGEKDTFTLSEALAHLQKRGIVPECYDEDYLRTSSLAKGYCEQMIARAFERIDEDRFKLLDAAK